ncbi:hypothetical protein V6N12_066495 [Hibiscus sabdariffa]|uniref:EF-hand domain-containing protein n=1 Tax=Hibiscus sabdariffa TaxID=183260 RepID=A0ABR2CQA5_9ROSI
MPVILCGDWKEASVDMSTCSSGPMSLLIKYVGFHPHVSGILRADHNGNHATYSAFSDALRQVNLTGLSYGSSFQETEDLWVLADTNGNGVLAYEEFKRIDEDCSSAHSNEDIAGEEAIGFEVKKAFSSLVKRRKGYDGLRATLFLIMLDSPMYSRQ